MCFRFLRSLTISHAYINITGQCSLYSLKLKLLYNFFVTCIAFENKDQEGKLLLSKFLLKDTGGKAYTNEKLKPLSIYEYIKADMLL